MSEPKKIIKKLLTPRWEHMDVGIRVVCFLVNN